MRPSPTAPPFRDVTVGDLLSGLARALSGRPALLYENGPRYTFAELDMEARLVARGLIAHGVGRGERVVVWATNVPEWIVLQFALAKIGAILVTANTALRARDIDYLLRQSEASTLVTIRGVRDVDYISALEEIGATRRAIPLLSRLIFIGRGGEITPPGFLPYEDLRADALRVPDALLDACSAAVGEDDVINMQYTSGTTGFPKGVMLSSRNIVNNAEALGRMLAYTPEDRLCLCVPLFHCVDPAVPQSADELILWCSERLARFKVPKYVRFVSAFPMTASGKIQKFKLREEHQAELQAR